MYIDFHSHYFNEIQLKNALKTSEMISISFYDRENFENFLALDFCKNKNVKIQIGCHPWYFSEDFFEYIKKSLKCETIREKICGIGEIGFDFAKGKYQKNPEIQEKYFIEQVELAIEHNLPIIIHNVKGFAYLTKNVKLLKKVKKCVFHSFSGTFREANFFIKNNVDCIFTFGKNILIDNKRAIECISNLSVKNLGIESDFTTENQILIKDVYEKMYNIRNIITLDNKKKFEDEMKTNFCSVFT